MSYQAINGHLQPNNEVLYMDSRSPLQRPTSASTETTQDDIEVVRVQPTKIALVDETSENTLHRALNANQVCFAIYHVIAATHAISTSSRLP